MNYDSSEENLQQRLEQIQQNLRAPALNRRKAALDELAQCPAEVAVPILRSLAHEPDFMLRRLAVMGLGNHRTSAAFEVLRQILEQERDANVLGEAANSLFEFGDVAIPELQHLFERSDHWLVRQTIISLLIGTQHNQVLLSLVKAALQDETETVREAAILALNQILNSPLREQALTLLTVLADDSDWRTRWRTATALHGCPDPQAKQLLAKLQRDQHYRVVAAALDSATV